MNKNVTTPRTLSDSQFTVTQAYLRELLSYNQETGVFTWKVTRGGPARGARIGRQAGATTTLGYVYVGIDNKTYLAHRLAWLYVHGHWPEHQIDHINGVRTDNRLSNLREATQSENSQNLRAPLRSGSSGFLGVTWHKKARKWQARINVDRRDNYLGLFESAEEAHAAYVAAKRQLHPRGTL